MKYSTEKRFSQFSHQLLDPVLMEMCTILFRIGLPQSLFPKVEISTLLMIPFLKIFQFCKIYYIDITDNTICACLSLFCYSNQRSIVLLRENFIETPVGFSFYVSLPSLLLIKYMKALQPTHIHIHILLEMLKVEFSSGQRTNENHIQHYPPSDFPALLPSI